MDGSPGNLSIAGVDGDYGFWTGAVNESGIRIESRADFVALCNFAVRLDLSDLIIQTGRPVFASHHGRLVALTKPLRKATVEAIMVWATRLDSITSRLSRCLDFDMAFDIPDNIEVDRWGQPVRHRFRLNLTSCYFEGGLGYQAVMRYIPSEPPNVTDARLHPTILANIDPHQGSVFFTGETGSGKTYTCASIIRYMLEGHSRIRGNVVTYESPIEFVLTEIPSGACTIAQEEIGLHLADFPSAVRNSLRRKPGLLFLGELRDAETIAASLECGSVGVPLLATAHANRVSVTLRRLMQKFPPDRQSQAFYDVLTTTHMIVNQRLVNHADYTHEKPKMVCLREFQVFDDDLRRQLEDAGPERHGRVLQSILDAPGNTMGQSMRGTVRQHLADGEITRHVALQILAAYGYPACSLDSDAPVEAVRIDQGVGVPAHGDYGLAALPSAVEPEAL